MSRRTSDLDVGPLPVDPLFAVLGPSAHLDVDLFASTIAFGWTKLRRCRCVVLPPPP